MNSWQIEHFYTKQHNFTDVLSKNQDPDQKMRITVPDLTWKWQIESDLKGHYGSGTDKKLQSGMRTTAS